MRGHVRKRASGTWAAVLDAGRDPETGRRKQKWLSGFATECEALDALEDLLGSKRRGETLTPSKMTLADYLTTWLLGREDELASLSVARYRSAVRTHITTTPIGSMPLGNLTRPHLRAFERHLRDKGLAAGTRKIVRTTLARALADAVEDGLLSRSPMGRRLAENAKAPSRFTVWTKDELRAFLTVVEGDRLEGLWRLAVAAGLRRGELLGCTWFGFSAVEGTLTISQQAVPTPGGPTIAPLKTKGSHRTIRLDEETVASLERHRERQLVERDRADEAYDDRDLIFATELGGVINPKRLTEAFGTHREAAKIRAGRLHDVRHSHATDLLSAGIPVHIVSSRLGHASPMVTMSVYAHVLPRSDERAAEVMADVLA